MNASTKVFATLSLAAAIGKKIQKITDNQELHSAATQLNEAGRTAAAEYPFATLSTSKTIQIFNAVSGLLDSPTDTPAILSMLIAGLVDIHARCKPERHKIIDPVITCAQQCLDLLNDETDHDKAFEKYERWCAA